MYLRTAFFKKKKIFIYLHKLIAHRWQKGGFVFFYPFPHIYKKLHGVAAMKLLRQMSGFAEGSFCEETACDSIPRASELGDWLVEEVSSGLSVKGARSISQRLLGKGY